MKILSRLLWSFCLISLVSFQADASAANVEYHIAGQVWGPDNKMANAEVAVYTQSQLNLCIENTFKHFARHHLAKHNQEWSDTFVIASANVVSKESDFGYSVKARLSIEVMSSIGLEAEAAIQANKEALRMTAGQIVVRIQEHTFFDPTSGERSRVYSCHPFLWADEGQEVFLIEDENGTDFVKINGRNRYFE